MIDQVWNSQPSMTRVLGTYVFANLRLTTTPKEVKVQVLKRLSTTLAKKKYRQRIKYERKYIRGARLSLTHYRNAPS